MLRPSLLFIWLMVVMTIVSCNSAPKGSDTTISTGPWRMSLELVENTELPFDFDLNETEEGFEVIVKNSLERIEVNEVEISEDSFFMRMPIFDSEFHGKIIEGKKIEGYWTDLSRGKDYKIPFTATYGEQPRFIAKSKDEPIQLAPTWEAVFSPESETDVYPAIGKFIQTGNRVTGTFLTEIGDYRYLEGIVEGNQLKLSAFDGSHAFLLIADLDDEGNLKGNFWSGSHWLEPWVATPNPDAELREPDAITYLKEGYDKVNFAFPNLAGDTITLDDPLYQDKVVIIQLMGSWCPNCMDETKLFSKWYRQYQNQGLEIVGVAFERSPDLETAARNLSRLKEHFNVGYEYVIASIKNDKAIAEEKFPMLNRVISFPTAIYIDRTGKVRKIHTGFNGPGTGEPYQRFVDEYGLFIESLLREGNADNMAKK